MLNVFVFLSVRIMSQQKIVLPGITTYKYYKQNKSITQKKQTYKIKYELFYRLATYDAHQQHQ